MSTIFKIIGGGQKVRQNTELGLKTKYKIVENSDWIKKTQCDGQDSFTNTMWSTSFDDLQRWSNDWAGQQIELIKDEEC